jgi:hypothetical protein
MCIIPIRNKAWYANCNPIRRNLKKPKRGPTQKRKQTYDFKELTLEDASTKGARVNKYP